MQYEIKTTRFHRKLIGVADKRSGEQSFAEAGMSLMEKLEPALKSVDVKRNDVIHWVYDSPNDLFVGVEITDERMDAPEGVEYRYINCHRRLEYEHVGPYEELPGVWEALLAEVESLEETRLGPDLEIYTHHVDDPSQRRTTVMIGLLEPSDHAG